MDLGQSLNIQDQEATIVSLEQMNETEASTKENQNADDAARVDF